MTPPKIAPAGQVEVKVDLENTGKRQGKEVVQLYVNDLYSTTTTPVRALRGFEKISLKPGQKKTAKFVLKSEDLCLINSQMQRVVEPGVFEVMVGRLQKSFRVVE